MGKYLFKKVIMILTILLIITQTSVTSFASNLDEHILDNLVEKNITFSADNKLKYEFSGEIEISDSNMKVIDFLKSTNTLNKVDLMILLFISLFNQPIYQEEVIKNDNAYFEETYSLDFNDTNVSFILLNFDEFVNMDKTEESYIAVAIRNDCPYCHTIMPKYISISNDLNISKIYFIDTNTLNQEEKEIFRTKYGINVVPTSIIKFSNGSKEIIYGDIDEVDLRKTLSNLKEE